MESGFDDAVTANSPGHTFVVLEVEPLDESEQRLPYPPMDGPEMKYRFGRRVEELTGADVFGYRV